MANVVVFGLDYDGCADILFEEELVKHKAKLEKDHPQRFEKFLMLREELKIFLNDIARYADQVEVYDTSCRQSHELDQYNLSINKNGSCLTNFKKLCEEKKWTFRPLLLADVENNVAPGEALKNPSLRCTFDANKIKTLENQLSDIIKNHPNDEITYYFLDDLDKILSGLENHFGNGEEIPKNILFIQYKFAWERELREELYEILTISARIQGRKELAREEKSSSAASLTSTSTSQILNKVGVPQVGLANTVSVESKPATETTSDNNRPVVKQPKSVGKKPEPKTVTNKHNKHNKHNKQPKSVGKKPNKTVAKPPKPVVKSKEEKSSSIPNLTSPGMPKFFNKVVTKTTDADLFDNIRMRHDDTADLCYDW